MPYGHRGNGVVNYHAARCEADGILYVAGFSKAYSSLAAGVACSARFKTFLKAYATPYDLSGPSPVASLASLYAGLKVNELRGEGYRARLFELTRATVDGLRELGFEVQNRTYFPIASVWIGDTTHLIEISRLLFEAGVLVTLGPYPMVPRGSEVLRITVTSANTMEQVVRLLHGFRLARDYLTRARAPLTRAQPRAAVAG
jgi:8-amino-7-oxononanoate synthase